MPENTPVEEKQCRICLDGPEAEFELGRLIRPCLCKGSISVRVKYPKQTTLDNANQSAPILLAVCACKVSTTLEECFFFQQCLLFLPTMSLSLSLCKNERLWNCNKPRCASILPIISPHRSQPPSTVVVGSLSAIFFTTLVILSSFLTTFFMSSVDEPSYWNYFYVNPADIVGDLVRASVRILRDEEGIFYESFSAFSSHKPTARAPSPPIVRPPPGLLKRFIHRFLLGLPVVGAGSIVHMLFSLPFIGPVRWLARYRGNRDRRGNSRDMATILIVVLIVVGAARQVIYFIYPNFTSDINPVPYSKYIN